MPLPYFRSQIWLSASRSFSQIFVEGIKDIMGFDIVPRIYVAEVFKPPM